MLGQGAGEGWAWREVSPAAQVTSGGAGEDLGRPPVKAVWCYGSKD